MNKIIQTLKGLYMQETQIINTMQRSYDEDRFYQIPRHADRRTALGKAIKILNEDWEATDRDRQMLRLAKEDLLRLTESKTNAYNRAVSHGEARKAFLINQQLLALQEALQAVETEMQVQP